MKNSRVRVIAVAAVASLLIVSTGMLIVTLPKRREAAKALPAQSVVLDAEAEDPLTAYRTERDQLRQKHRAELNDIIHDDATDPGTLGLAQRQLMEQMAREEKETTLEALLAAKGFDGVVVSATNQSVNVIVPSEPLDRHQTAVILELVLRETGVTAGNVKIVAIN